MEKFIRSQAVKGEPQVAGLPHGQEIRKSQEKLRKSRGPQTVKGGATRPQFETYFSILFILTGVDDEEQKKNLGILNGSFETYSRCYDKKIGNVGGHKP